MGKLTVIALGCIALVGSILFTEAAALAQSDDDKRARELYREGEEHYAAGRYEEAAENFEEAYELSKRPQLLFNLGNAHERIGNHAVAIDYLSRYLESKVAVDRETVRTRIRRLEVREKRRKDKEKREREARQKKLERDNLLRLEREKGIVEPPPPSRLPVYILMGSGAGALAGAAVLGLLSNSAGNDGLLQCSEAGGQTICPRAAQGDFDREKNLALFADISAGVGVLAVGAGVFVLWRQSRGSGEDAGESVDGAEAGTTVRAAPQVFEGGLGVGLVGSF